MLWWWYTRRIESVESGWVDHTGHCRFNVLGRAIGNSVERRLSFSKHYEARELMRYVNWCADAPYSKRKSHRPFLNVPRYHSAWVMWGPLGFLGECPNSQGNIEANKNDIDFIPPSFLVLSSLSVVLKAVSPLPPPTLHRQIVATSNAVILQRHCPAKTPPAPASRHRHPSVPQPCHPPHNTARRMRGTTLELGLHKGCSWGNGISCILRLNEVLGSSLAKKECVRWNRYINVSFFWDTTR